MPGLFEKQRENSDRIFAALVAFIALALWALPAPVHAQDDAAGSDQTSSDQTSSGQRADDEAKAESYYNKGVEAFFEKNFPQAITYFQRAHALDPDPVVLFNISLSHSKMGNPAEALEAALEAEQMGGLPKDTLLKTRFRIVAYRRAIAAIEVTEAINPPVVEVDDSTGDDHSVTDPAPVDDGLGFIGWTGVGVGSLGVGALIGAGVLNFIVAGNLEEYDTARADGDYGRASGLHSDIGDRQEMGRVLLYSGAGLAAVGAALFAYDFFGSPEAADGSEQASVFGAVESDGASLQLRWAF